MRSISKRICCLVLICVLSASLLSTAVLAKEVSSQEGSGSTPGETGDSTSTGDATSTGDITQAAESVSTDSDTAVDTEEAAALTIVYSPYYAILGAPAPETRSYPTGTVVDLSELTVPAWTGYVFTAWYDTEDTGDDTHVIETVTMDADKTIYAGWTMGGSVNSSQTHTLTLVYSSVWRYTGEGDPDVLLTFNANETVDLTTLVISGHEGDTDTAWYESASWTPSSPEITTVTMNADKTLYAGSKHASINSNSNVIALHYETNGGEPLEDDYFDASGVYSLDKVPTREGYIFVGWYDDETLSVKFGSAIPMFSSRTIYAGWEEVSSSEPVTLTIVYHTSYGASGTPIIDTESYDKGTVVDLNDILVPEWPGYTFTGWYDFSGLSTGSAPITRITMSADKTIYAGWATTDGTISKYTLTYDTNGGSALESESYGGITIISLTDKVPAREGYDFAGWYDEQLCSGSPITSITLTRDRTIYAKWTEAENQIIIRTLTLVYDPLWQYIGGSNPDVTMTFQDSTVVDLSTLEIPGHEGASPVTWYADSGLDAIVTQVTMDADKTIYAGQMLDGAVSQGYTLTYETNGGSELASEHYNGITSVDLTEKIPTREGYTFDGWYENQLFLNDPIPSITLTRDRTIYAKWTEAAEDTADSTSASNSSSSSNSGSGGHKTDTSKVPPLLNGDVHSAYIIGDNYGLIRPAASLTRAETATIFFRLLEDSVRDSSLTTENPFSDVSAASWYNTAVSTLASLGIVNGRSSDVFAPNSPITRAELAAICARFDDSVTTGDSVFSDVAQHWAQAEIQRAAALGWVNGYPDGTFRPDQSITRAEAMTLINRVLCRLPENAEDLLADMTTWPDNADPEQWYYLAVQEATNSHDFQQKDSDYEAWSHLTADPDWTQYET